MDESTRRPVNTRTAVELKSCQADLSRAAIRESELARAQASTISSAIASPMAASLPADANLKAVPAKVKAAVEETGNVVAVVPFGMGSAAWSVEQSEAAVLVRRANESAVIMIRGRTDATGDSFQETTLARRRAEVAAEFLQQAGVSRGKLRLTWQGAGDPLAGLRPSDRAQSRRVEIEFYTAAPTLVSLRNGAGNGKNSIAASL